LKGVIDRFEGKFAVVELEDGRIINICKKKFPARQRKAMY
jgi:hypothetical protein